MRSVVSSARRRQLYEWDFGCSTELSGKRSLTAYKRVHQSTGSFGSASSVIANVTKAHAGFATGTNWGMAYHRGTFTSWDKSADGTYTNLSNPGIQNGIGFVPGMWRETSAVDRVFYSYWQEWPTQYDEYSRHAVRQIYSSNDFATQTADYLYHCTSMTGYFTCSNYAALASPGRLSVAYHQTINRSVVAWLNQERTNVSSSPSNEIWISVGHVANNRLSLPEKTGIRSAVPPGIACNADFSGSYDCVLLYVPIDDLTLRISAKHVQVVPESYGYRAYVNPMEYKFPSGSRTSGPIAVWWNAGQSKFYAAWRRTASNQPIGVRSSAMGATWDFETSNLDSTYIAPSVANMFQGTNNLLVYAK